MNVLMIGTPEVIAIACLYTIAVALIFFFIGRMTKK